MTLSRAVKELTAAGIATLRTEGRVRWLHTERTAAQTWSSTLETDAAQPGQASDLDDSPLRSRGPGPLRLAGLSALARFSMLTEPRVADLRRRAGGVEGGDTGRLRDAAGAAAGACEWELWHYSPALVRDSDTVDPLSLTLSLQGNQDERVQLALDELKGHFPW